MKELVQRHITELAAACSYGASEEFSFFPSEDLEDGNFPCGCIDFRQTVQNLVISYRGAESFATPSYLLRYADASCNCHVKGIFGSTRTDMECGRYSVK